MTCRRGSALLIAIALLALASALLAGASSASRAATRSQETNEAALAADAECRIALGDAVEGWGAAEDSLAVGMSLVRTLVARHGGLGSVPVQGVVRIQRISGNRYVVVASTRAGAASLPAARRRRSVLLERRSSSDSLSPILSPAPAGQWAVTDLF